MKKIIVISLLGSSSLVACNGGGSSGSPSPAPTPTPTPAPTIINHAYFTNFGNNSYTQCGVSTNGIESGTCTTIKPTGIGTLNWPMGIAFHGNYAYIANSASEGGYTRCAVNLNGIIESDTCTTIVPVTNVGALSYDVGIAFSGDYAYFSSSISSTVPAWNNNYTQCTVGANDIESNSCMTITPTGIGMLNGPYLLAISGNYAYFPNMNSTSYTQCAINMNGIESDSCTVITPAGSGVLNNPAAITFSGNYAYITNLNNWNGGSYTQCGAGVNGIDYTSCATITPTGAGALSSPYGIAVNGNYAYIVNGDGNSYTQCAVSVSGIDSATCRTITPTSTGALNYPVGIAFK